MHEKKKILIFIDWFLPGYKAGGPVRSMANMVEYLGDRYDFYIVTRNTDYTETVPYDGISPNQWIDFAPAVKVFYCSQAYQNLSFFRKIIKMEKFDVAYVNGIYSWKYSILPLIALRKFAGKKIVASRGMLATSAINVKGGKKRLFLSMVKWLNLYKGVTFHATNEREKEDVKREIGSRSKVVIADNLPKKNMPEKRALEKRAGKLKLVSLARISPEKNTLFAIKCLKQLGDFDGEINLDLYGQIYNQTYWEQCKTIIRRLPKNIAVTHKGIVDAEKVGETIQDYHVMFLPSRGENFGHVILESFMAGRPVLISDQTPWRELEKDSCGWDLSLVEEQGPVSKEQEAKGKESSNAKATQDKEWGRVLHELLRMQQEKFDILCEGAEKRATAFINDPGLLKAYEGLLEC
ncbi:Glycosyltransferase involved in cell wall bisynthesis [Saccharicrinis carchari]|uniref:Glycosyltransferase involved in cell wall bisynthesis n=1 Tax=Saccharicrinis carchari TaxID=1168039 RepID=A0A521AJW3_SACCC|nr:glycosyltransferase family 4 protein [Saccharicrinis carchari]SMO35124.1 Glycosyltransferase involved in cell wall bisynthesis [Saccharicrinis carchari]